MCTLGKNFANNGGGMKDMSGLTDALQILSGPFDRKQEGYSTVHMYVNLISKTAFGICKMMTFYYCDQNPFRLFFHI